MEKITSKSEILKRIENQGFCEIECTVSDKKLNNIQQIIKKAFEKPMINGQSGYVLSKGYKYLYQTLSWSKDIVDFYTNEKLIDIIETYQQSKVHISNYRIYSSNSKKSSKMPWHTDNKIDFFDEEKEKFITKLAPNDKGIIMISYLSDVIDGGLQIVKGSHKWAFNEEVWEGRENEFVDKIVTFNNRKAGTTIIYDYRCIHRAKPYTSKTKEDRISAFAQFSSENMPVGEPILLPTEYSDTLSSKQKQLLNFGLKPSTKNWPIGMPYEISQFSWGLKKRLEYCKGIIRKILK
ncbi:MAG: phytanoyl-CoA dioxygenase family protein [Flavobacteriaceae bacterium]